MNNLVGNINMNNSNMYMKNSELKTDLIKFWSLFVVFIVITYFSPMAFQYALFLFVIAKIATSNRYNYFWIGFWFMLLNAPGNLFIGDLPYIQVSSSARLNFIQLIPLALIYKVYFKKGNINKNILKKEFQILFIVFILFFIIGMMYGMNKNNILNTIFILINGSLLFTLPSIFSQSTMVKLDQLLFSVIIISFVAHLSLFVFGISWIDLVKGSNDSILTIDGDNPVRVMSSAYIILYGLHKASFYLFSRNNIFSTRYLNLIIGISIFSILLSATRGWILALIISLGLVFIFFSQYRGAKKIFSLVFSLTVIITITILIIPKYQIQIEKSLLRFQTVESLAKGDLTMNNNLYRITHRAPKMLSVIKEKPIFGYGFSKGYWDNRDRHIGHLVLLLNCGVLGYIFFMFLFLKLFRRLYTLSSRNHLVRFKYGKAPKILSFGLIFIFVINSTSHYYWGFDIERAPFFALVLLLSSYNAIAVTTPPNLTQKRIV